MTTKLRALTWVGLLVMVIGATGVAQGAWILAKAEVAQVLLEWAWYRVEQGEAETTPWPWADTWPVARLEAPERQVDLIVLSGASGAVLAFGPGHIQGTALPGASGHSIIAGHRDTHFEFLRDLAIGDEIVLTAPESGRAPYRVERVWITDESDPSVFDAGAGEWLTLVTCFPFDTLETGGSLRYLVRARRHPEDPKGAPVAPFENAHETNYRLARLYR